MTTVAYRDGILAADTQVTVDSVKLIHGPKIHILNENTVYAAAGDVNSIEYLKRYYAKPEWDLDDKKAKKRAKYAEALLWYKGKMFVCEHALIPVPLHHPYYALGSGWTFALSSMEHGASAEDAVRFASKFDVYTNNNVQVVNVKDLEGKTGQSAQGRKKPRVPQA